MRSRVLIALGAVAMLAASVALAAVDFPFVKAIKRRDHKAITSLLGQGVDINAVLPDGATALAWAIHLGDRETTDKLLAAGARVDTVDEYGESPLTLACANGDAAAVEKLLKAGAKPGAARVYGETALMIAAGAGSVEAVKALIAHKADVNAIESRRGQTALMWAAAEGHSAVVRTLVELGANVNAVSTSGFSALVFAATKNDVKSIQSLLAAGANPNGALPDGTTVLHVAAAYQSTAAAAALLESGADWKLTDRDGNTPLHAASQAGDLELVRSLLAKGADPNVRTARSASRDGQGGGGYRRGPSGEMTPLLTAARGNQVDIMRALVAGGADTTLKAQDGTTLLIAAAGSGHIEAAQYAYEFDKDVKAATNTGFTAMHATVAGTLATSTQPEICKLVQYLADIGVPLDEMDARGRTPIQTGDVIPVDQPIQLMAELILQRGGTPKAFPKEFLAPPGYKMPAKNEH